MKKSALSLLVSLLLCSGLAWGQTKIALENQVKGSLTITTGKTLTLVDMTLGSTLFAGTGGLVSQDNDHYRYDPATRTLYLGDATHNGTLELTSTSGQILQLAGSDPASTSSPALFAPNGVGDVALRTGNIAGADMILRSNDRFFLHNLAGASQFEFIPANNWLYFPLGTTPFNFEGSVADAFETTFTVTNPTADRTFTLPDANSVAVQPDTGAANNFLTAISALGVISKAQPAFSNLSGQFTSAQAPTSLTTSNFGILIGADNGAVLVDGDDQPTFFRAPRAITITEVWCESDAGTPSINLQRDDGTPADILSANLSCTTGGATGTIAAAEDNVAVDEKIDLVMVAAGGVAKRISVFVKYTVD